MTRLDVPSSPRCCRLEKSHRRSSRKDSDERPPGSEATRLPSKYQACDLQITGASISWRRNMSVKKSRKAARRQLPRQKMKIQGRTTSMQMIYCLQDRWFITNMNEVMAVSPSVGGRGAARAPAAIAGRVAAVTATRDIRKLFFRIGKTLGTEWYYASVSSGLSVIAMATKKKLVALFCRSIQWLEEQLNFICFQGE